MARLEIREGYSDNKIYIAEATALFLKLTPDKAFLFRDKKCLGTELAKEKNNILYCYKYDGKHKQKFVFNGKPKQRQDTSKV